MDEILTFVGAIVFGVIAGYAHVYLLRHYTPLLFERLTVSYFIKTTGAAESILALFALQGFSLIISFIMMFGLFVGASAGVMLALKKYRSASRAKTRPQ